MDVEPVPTFTANEQPAATAARRYSYAKLLRAMVQTLDAQSLASLEMAYHGAAYFIRTVAYKVPRADWSLKRILQEPLSGLGWIKEKQACESCYSASEAEL